MNPKDTPTFHYVLIQTCDHSGLQSIRSFPTQMEREKATRLLLDGWDEEPILKMLAQLEEDGICEFEGDPPLHWMTAVEFTDPAANKIRTQYAGTIGLLCDLHIKLDDSPEEQESIRHAVSDWCRITGWTMKRVISRLEVFPPETTP